MQYPFSCTLHTYDAIEATLSQPRLGRYLGAATNDKHLALRLYVWNARLCEEFYIPTQLAEIAFRNTLARGLRTRYGDDWHKVPALTAGLPNRLQLELSKVEKDERHRHGVLFTSDHVVSGLSLGFWVHLTSANPRKYIWRNAIKDLFPHIPAHKSEANIHDAADRLRKWRNRIAHHNAVFDKSPTAEYRNIQDLLGWICPETLWLAKQLANPAKVISRRPR